MAPGGVLLHDGALLIRCALEIECRDANFAEDTGGARHVLPRFTGRGFTFAASWGFTGSHLSARGALGSSKISWNLSLRRFGREFSSSSSNVGGS